MIEYPISRTREHIHIGRKIPGKTGTQLTSYILYSYVFIFESEGEHFRCTVCSNVQYSDGIRPRKIMELPNQDKFETLNSGLTT
jgi:hypothetical protein